MADVITLAIDAVQDANRAIVSRRKVQAPRLEQYPQIVDTARCPILLTHTEGITFDPRIEDRTTIQIVTQLLFDPIGQGQFGDTMRRIHLVMDDLRSFYANENSYEIVGHLVLCKTPASVSVVSEFSISGYRIIDYPRESGMWYHGSELRFTVETNQAIEDCE